MTGGLVVAGGKADGGGEKKAPDRVQKRGGMRLIGRVDCCLKGGGGHLGIITSNLSHLYRRGGGGRMMEKKGDQVNISHRWGGKEVIQDLKRDLTL